MGICRCKKRLDGKVVIITGANSGSTTFCSTILLIKRPSLLLYLPVAYTLNAFAIIIYN
jgi:hypothetical protein